MGIHDFKPPPNIKMRTAVQKFFKLYLDLTDDNTEESAAAYVNLFTEDGVFHGQRTCIGRQEIYDLRQELYPLGAPHWQHTAGDIYPLNHSTDSAKQLYLITGLHNCPSGPCGRAGGRESREWRCSVLLVEVPGEGLKIKSFNTLGNEKSSTDYRSIGSDVGIFRY
ncbi:hypothetical protein LTR17_024811 [Elasticomyces elasticus]|nr:hypothetical protein LTR17_024811 [Elasticomyces elasticus]